ncbi:fungal specific transcription factor domain-containing protein [Fusarium coicis]|nr:fungal specific transcription factor domain-containing protein [Fusarium coicis]
MSSRYIDSGADIAYNLSLSPNVDVICPRNAPKPKAVKKGASHIWANPILFSSHPLQVSARLVEHQDHIKVVGQGPLIVERYDDKEFVNNLLRKLGGFTMPRAWTLNESQDTQGTLEKLDLPFPIVAKPIRGRGSHGVRVCRSLKELIEHAQALFKESPSIMVEEYLAGEEATFTVMPPTWRGGSYWALPVVTRFNHIDGVAPYNGWRRRSHSKLKGHNRRGGEPGLVQTGGRGMRKGGTSVGGDSADSN